MYFRVKPDSNLAWSLIEQSMDETVRRVLDPAEDPSSAVDLWGKSRVRKLSPVLVIRVLASNSDLQRFCWSNWYSKKSGIF